MQTHRAGNPDRKHRSKNSKAEIRSGNLQRGIIRHRAGAPGKCPARFAVSVNDTIKCNRKKKRSSYESLVECNHHKNKKPKACFATLAERKTRFYIAVKMPDRRAETMENAIVSALARLPATGERNLRTGARSSGGLAAKCILPIRTVHGKRARMKMQTACFERFIRKRNLSRVAPATLK